MSAQINEWTNRIKEFVSKIEIELQYRPETLTASDFLEIHWLVDEVKAMEELLKEILVKKSEEKAAAVEPSDQ